MTEKVFVSEKRTATFVCPECKRTKTTDVSAYLKSDKLIKVKCRCTCGHAYSALLERRKFFRKETSLPGVYTSVKKERRPMTVMNLSRTGLKFKLHASDTLKAGDRLVVEFNLDDPQQSLIRKEVIVKNIKNSNIGAAFVSTDEYDKLGFYLMR
jgi:hypothetical protein